MSTCAFYYSELIREQYRLRNGGEDTTVRGNDVAFAVHALLLSIITLSQFWPWLWGFETGGNRSGGKVGKGTWAIVVVGLLYVAWAASQVTRGQYRGGGGQADWEWIDVVYAVGYVKLMVTVFKYIPQAWTNYKRKSTEGWSIGQILMDVLGGVLSIAQLLIDSSLQKDWSGLTGNPVKFGLGNVSILFDVVFMTQHYVLYRQPRDEMGEGRLGERRGLLASNDEEAAMR